MSPDLDRYAITVERDESNQAARLVFVRQPGVETIAGESVPCKRPSCANVVPPQKTRRGEAKVYCSRRCGSLHWDETHPRQKALDFAPPPEPLPPVADQRVSPREVRRLGQMSQAILERLHQGPASNRDIALMFPPGAAWRTRLSDVRAFLRGGNRDCEPVPHHDCGGGLVWYWLETL